MKLYSTNSTHLSAEERSEVWSVDANVVVGVGRVRALSDVLHSIDRKLGVVHSSGVSRVLVSSKSRSILDKAIYISLAVLCTRAVALT